MERFYQTLTQMISKLNSDEKADWLSHLPKLIQAYNGTRSAITGYSPHYLMFGRRSRFPVDMYFPTMGSGKEAYHVHQYITTLQQRLKAMMEEAHYQNNLEVKRQI